MQTTGRYPAVPDDGFGEPKRRFPSDLAKLRDMDNYELADHEADSRGWEVIGRDGEEIGTINGLIASPSQERAYFAIVDAGGWFEDRRFALPLDQFQFDTREKKAHAPYVREQFREAPQWSDDFADYETVYSYWEPAARGAAAPATSGQQVGPGEIRVPLVEEDVEVTRTSREVGGVVVRKRVDVETQHISEPVSRSRVSVDVREVSPDETYHHEGATTIGEGQTLRIPITEEELRVEKIPRVTKEVVVETHRETEQVERDIELRHEEVDIDEQGDVDVHQPAAPGRRR